MFVSRDLGQEQQLTDAWPIYQIYISWCFFLNAARWKVSGSIKTKRKWRSDMWVFLGFFHARNQRHASRTREIVGARLFSTTSTPFIVSNNWKWPAKHQRGFLVSTLQLGAEHGLTLVWPTGVAGGNIAAVSGARGISVWNTNCSELEGGRHKGKYNLPLRRRGGKRNP